MKMFFRRFLSAVMKFGFVFCHMLQGFNAKALTFCAWVNHFHFCVRLDENPPKVEPNQEQCDDEHENQDKGEDIDTDKKDNGEEKGNDNNDDEDKGILLRADLECQRVKTYYRNEKVKLHRLE